MQGSNSDMDDPKGLIRESFRIEGIGSAECRSILMDWAISLDGARDQRAALARLHDRYAAALPDHPMAALMREAATAGPAEGRRRGGRAGRLAGEQ